MNAPVQWACKSKAQEDYDNVYNKTAEELAEERGCTVLYPKVNELQLDIDSAEAYENFLLQRAILNSRNNILLESETTELVSKSGLPHRHIIIRLKDRVLDERERILLQLGLGSDPVRERINTMRLMTGVTRPTRLFRPKGESL